MGTENMEFLKSASRICFVIAAAALLLSITLFFLLDIRNVLLIETGCARSKAVREMNEKNRRTTEAGDDSARTVVIHTCTAAGEHQTVKKEKKRG